MACESWLTHVEGINEIHTSGHHLDEDVPIFDFGDGDFGNVNFSIVLGSRNHFSRRHSGVFHGGQISPKSLRLTSTNRFMTTAFILSVRFVTPSHCILYMSVRIVKVVELCTEHEQRALSGTRRERRLTQAQQDAYIQDDQLS